MSSFPISFQDITNAKHTLQNVAAVTPTLTSETASKIAGADLFFKCENLQRIGAFKFRGAYNALAKLSAEQKSKGVVTFSAGNHGQAIALAAQILHVRATVIMPEDAPKIKLESVREFGAEVILYNRYTEDREKIAENIITEKHLTLIPPYDHPDVISGQGTTALELIEQVGPLDYILAPIGGGGLISGCAIAIKTQHPETKIIGVEPENGNDAQQSLRLGKIVKIEVPQTIADGAQTRCLGNLTFPIIKELVHDIVTVTDAELTETMIFLAKHMKLIVEPTGCLAAAAVLHKKISIQGKRVGMILTAGNIDILHFANLIKQ